MDREQIASYARMLLEAHGNTADVAAARRQVREERSGNHAEAEKWKRIRTAIAAVIKDSNS